MAWKQRFGDATRSAWRAVERYADHPDPLVLACNWMALVVASNQPFYPLFVEWTAGDGGRLAMLTWLSTPFFLAVPAVSRVSSPAGRALLPLAGLANTLLAQSLFGLGSGVALFLGPCLVLAGLAFRPAERRWAFSAVSIGILACIVVRFWPWPPQVDLAPGALDALLDINAVGAASLLVLAGFSFAKAYAVRAPAASDPSER